MSKRLQLAHSMERLGITRLLEFFRAKPGLLVINHHRIGNASQSRFDRAMYSASRDELDQQIAYIKRQCPILCGEELEAVVANKQRLDRLYAAITFDDGYRDNFTEAFPVLQAHGCCGIFFLVPLFVGTNTIPWWDAIAYWIRNSRRKVIELTVPVPLTVQLTPDREDAIYRILQHYKRRDNVHCDDFMREMREQADCDLPDAGRRFLDWSEAAEMQKSGMMIGSHTVTHRILSQLSEQEQQQELAESRRLLQERLGTEISSIAYPVGIRSAFTAETETFARAAGYQVAFSFFGGVNSPESLRPFNILRTSVEPDPVMFRNQWAFMTRFGKLPYV